MEFYEDDGAAALLVQEMDSPGAESYRLAEVYRWDEITCEILTEDKRITEDLTAAIDESDWTDTAPWKQSRARCPRAARDSAKRLPSVTYAVAHARTDIIPIGSVHQALHFVLIRTERAGVKRSDTVTGARFENNAAT